MKNNIYKTLGVNMSEKEEEKIFVSKCVSDFINCFNSISKIIPKENLFEFNYKIITQLTSIFLITMKKIGCNKSEEDILKVIFEDSKKIYTLINGTMKDENEQ
jgi:hypothetical protein